MGLRDPARAREGFCVRQDGETTHFLQVLDELNHLEVEFISFRENIDTTGPLGRAIVVIVGAISELERSLIIESVRAGTRRARLEGRHIGRTPLSLDREAIRLERGQGQSIRMIARNHSTSTATVQRVLHEQAAAPKTVESHPYIDVTKVQEKPAA